MTTGMTDAEVAAALEALSHELFVRGRALQGAEADPVQLLALGIAAGAIMRAREEWLPRARAN